MSRPIPARALTLAAVAALAASLAACGKTGELQRPGPLFGQGRSTTKQADEQVRQAQDPSRPVNTVDPRDTAIDPAPPRATPLPGQSPNPMSAGPQGALPNPYVNPR
jgi:predicted small lipoprotein YifL